MTANSLFITWVFPLRTCCQCTKAAAPLLVGRGADPGRSPAKDSEEAHVQELTLKTNKATDSIGLYVACFVA